MIRPRIASIQSLRTAVLQTWFAARGGSRPDPVVSQGIGADCGKGMRAAASNATNVSRPPPPPLCSRCGRRMWAGVDIGCRICGQDEGGNVRAGGPSLRRTGEARGKDAAPASEELLTRPEPPAPEECCESVPACPDCVYIVYQEDLDAFNRSMRERAARGRK